MPLALDKGVGVGYCNSDWFRMSVADGAKGPRVYDWAATRFGFPTDTGLVRWFLVRRHIETHEHAYYLCAAPPSATWM